VIGAPRIEEAKNADIAAISIMRRQMNWSRASDLLQAIQRWPGGRIFIIREGELANVSGEAAQRPAVVTVAAATPPIGVIGSVMVSPAFQRGGLGRIIMEHALDWLKLQGARQVYLDATPAGRPLYRRLGFVDGASSWYTRAPLATLDRAALRALAADGAPARVIKVGVKVGVAALSRLAALDRRAFGGDRLGLLTEMARQENHNLLIAERADGAPLGYLMARVPEPPLEGVRIGPLVAHNDATAAALLSAVLEREHAPQTGAFIASIAGDNPRALALFKNFGATPIEDDLIMRLDLLAMGNGAPEPPRDDGTRASAYCWLAPMVF
jgi:GNAT superfamily N-acetyltransferase